MIFDAHTPSSLAYTLESVQRRLAVCGHDRGKDVSRRERPNLSSSQTILVFSRSHKKESKCSSRKHNASNS